MDVELVQAGRDHASPLDRRHGSADAEGHRRGQRGGGAHQSIGGKCRAGRPEAGAVERKPGNLPYKAASVRH